MCNCGRKVKNEIFGKAEHKSLGGEAINVLSLKSLFSNISEKLKEQVVMSPWLWFGKELDIVLIS